jgi:flagellar basal-body rod protein FlgG
MFIIILSFIGIFSLTDALNTSSTGMEAQKVVIDNIANNFANINTNGFKKTRVDLQDLQYKTVLDPGAQTSLSNMHPTGIQIGRGVKVSGIKTNLEVGAIKATGNATDVAISSEAGYFAINWQGAIYYTRDGSFNKDASGKLISNTGGVLVPEINIPQEATGFSIGTDGTVNAAMADGQTVQIGQILIALFSNPGGLKRVGNNLLQVTNISGNPITVVPGTQGAGILQQGFIEGSNVNAVTDMVNMITAQRAYEMNSKVIQTADQMLQTIGNLR